MEQLFLTGKSFFLHSALTELACTQQMAKPEFRLCLSGPGCGRDSWLEAFGLLQAHKGIWASSEREKDVTTSTILGAAPNNYFFTSDQQHLSLIDFSCTLLGKAL